MNPFGFLVVYTRPILPPTLEAPINNLNYIIFTSYFLKLSIDFFIFRVKKIMR